VVAGGSPSDPDLTEQLLEEGGRLLDESRQLLADMDQWLGQGGDDPG
jgi:hypothetical protein